jgi:hypothetical protein
VGFECRTEGRFRNLGRWRADSAPCCPGEAHECWPNLGLNCATEVHSAIYLGQVGEGGGHSAESVVHWEAVGVAAVRWIVALSVAH